LQQFRFFYVYLRMNKNMVEIERKFLVKDGALDGSENFIEIVQGYLTKNEKGAVRVRIEREKWCMPMAYLMSKTNIDNMSNHETVDQISIENAELMLENFVVKKINKTRYIKIVDGFKWEIDKFHEPNRGLVLAEIELTSADQKITLPDWIDREVTGQPEYYNANM